MQSNRDYTVRKKSKVIIDKSFPVFKELNIGDRGQALIFGIIEAERYDEQQDGTQWLIKTVKMDKVELINNKQVRV